MGRLVPADEVSDPFLDAYPRAVAELTFRTPQIGRRETPTARLPGAPLDPRVAMRRAGEQADQPVQPHPLAAPEVDRDASGAAATSPVESGQDAIHRVTNIGVLALAGPVAVHRHGPIARHRVDEAVNGEVGALPRPVHGEEPQTQDAHPVQM